MQIRKLGTLGILAMALAMPGVSLAQNETKTEKAAEKAAAKAEKAAEKAAAEAERAAEKAERAAEKAERTQHGIGKGGVPAEVAGLDSRLEALEGQFVDDDGDTFSEVQSDCDDEDAAVNPLATEVAGNGIDDDCDHLTDEI